LEIREQKENAKIFLAKNIAVTAKLADPIHEAGVH